jgi:hypothetical protein
MEIVFPAAKTLTAASEPGTSRASRNTPLRSILENVWIVEGTMAIVSTPASAASPRAPASTLERWAPAAGSLFAALFVAAFIIRAAGLDTGDTLPEVTQNFASEDYQSTAGFVLLLILLSAPCFLWFLADLAATVRSLSPGMLASLVPIAGVVFITAVFVAATAFLAPLAIIGHSQLEEADPKTAATTSIILTEISLYLFGLAGIAGALLMSAAATAAYRGGLLPRWAVAVVVVGAVIAALGSWIYVFPILLFVLWVLAESVRRTIALRRV